MIRYILALGTGISLGLIALGPAAEGLTAIAASRCPGRTLVAIRALPGSTWGTWGACPRQFSSLPD